MALLSWNVEWENIRLFKNILLDFSSKAILIRTYVCTYICSIFHKFDHFRKVYSLVFGILAVLMYSLPLNRLPLSQTEMSKRSFSLDNKKNDHIKQIWLLLQDPSLYHNLHYILHKILLEYP